MKTFLLTLLMSFPAFAGFTVPAMPNPVNDYAKVLTASGKERIANEIVRLKKETGAQLGVLIVETLDGDSLEESSMAAAKAWGLGNKGDSDGLLLFLAIKDRKMRIEVGYGLENVITDYHSKQILGSMKSSLRSQDYDGAVLSAIKATSDRIKTHKEEINRVTTAPKTESGSNTFRNFMIIAMLLAVLGVIMFIRRLRKQEQEAEKKRKEEARLFLKKERDDREMCQAQLLKRLLTELPDKDMTPTVAKAAVAAAAVGAATLAARKRKQKEEEESSRRRDNSSSSSTYIASSYSSSDSGSSYSSSSSDSSSSWSGGGGDFGGGGSSDSW